MTSNAFVRVRSWFATLLLAVSVLATALPATAATPRPTIQDQRPAPRTTPPAGNPGRPVPLGNQLTARANGDAPVAGRVRVDVLVVYASNSGQVDPRLNELKRQLEMMKFTGFQVLSTHSTQLGASQSTQVSIEGGRKIEITLVSLAETQAKVRIELFRGSEKTVDTTVTIPRGRAYLVGGPKYQEGSLMFPITVAR
ncbi:MAG: hypothetical protein ABMB14_38840 [Myxococcota bacterium]